MRRINIYIIAGILIIFFLIFSRIYIFNIYEVTYTVNPQSMYADSKSTIKISAKPVNAFGWKAPLRSAPADFNIKDGKDLVDILSEDNSKGILIIKAKNNPGKIVLYINSKYSLFPSLLEIIVYPK